MTNIRTFLGTDKDLSSLFAIQSGHNLHLNFFFCSKELRQYNQGHFL